MSLRERLASRPRRRVVVSLSRPEAQADDQARRAAAARVVRAKSENQDPDQADLDLLAGPAPDSDDVAFTALPPDEFESLQAEHTAPDGTLDVPTMRPILLAACADDEDLQDAGWWAETLASGALSYGDRVTLWQAVYGINAQFGSVSAPKG